MKRETAWAANSSARSTTAPRKNTPSATFRAPRTTNAAMTHIHLMKGAPRVAVPAIVFQGRS